MNNLTQTQLDAKQAFLNNQAQKMLETYKQADSFERAAVIKQIDSFLEIVPNEAKRFWLSFRYKLERLNELQMLFPLGQIVMTTGAQEALEESSQYPFEFLFRHQKGDWGDLCQDDKNENELSVKEGFRILSSYRTTRGIKLWVITEHDRTVTTILLPEEY